MRKELLQGNEAVVRAAINSGCNFFAGYPITPSSEIAHGMAELLPRYGGVFVQMEDELASISAAIGAALAGAKAMTATSGPGFSLMQESIGYAAITETPIVIFDVMRAGPSTGIPTAPSQGDVLQAKHGSHGDYPVVVFAPATVEDSYYITEEAFRVAEEHRLPVIVLSDEIIGHMRESVILPPLKSEEEFRVRAGVEPRLGVGLRKHTTGLVYDETGMPTTEAAEYERLLRRLMAKLADESLLRYKTENAEDAEILFVAYGSTYRSVRKAVRILREESVKAGLFKLETLNPLPERALRKAAENAERIIVPEMNMGQMVKEVQAILCDREVSGISFFAELITPEELVKAVVEVVE
ncbi:MAG: 2-oxoacid:acceptor oxidoreductase subunit alpha [Archaeoglobus sp.]|nr:2-oxoacid:acceptor oxidoreductase subunit alpha [Archaeoglobus sp.]